MTIFIMIFSPSSGELFWNLATIALLTVLGVEFLALMAQPQRELVEEVAMVSELPEENPEPIFRVCLKGTIIYSNPAGFDHLDCLGVNSENKMPAEWIPMFKSVIQSRQVSSLEYRCVEYEQTFSGLFVPVIEGDNAENGYINIYVTEVTDRVRAEQEMRNQQSFTSYVLDTVPNIVFVKDKAGRFVTVNAAFADFYGRSIDDIIGKKSSDIESDPLVAEQYQRTDDQVIEQGIEFVAPAELKQDANEVDHWYHISKRPLLGDDGRFDFLLGVATDITAIKSVEDSLAEERNLLLTLMNNLPDYIYIKDIDSRLIMANPAHIELVGAESAKELIGKSDFDFYPEESTRPFFEAEQEIMRTGVPMISRVAEGWHNTKHEVIWLLETKVPLRDADGNIKGIIEISRDISEMKHAEIELRRAKDSAEAATRAKSAFLANMSHEIRTPMNAVVGMISLLWDTGLSNEQREYVETIRNSGDALLEIINEILDFSKIESEAIEIDIQHFDLDACIVDSLDLFAQRAYDKEIDLGYFIKPGIPNMIVGDRSRLRQILINLIGNAVKFTKEGQVTVTISRKVESSRPSITHFSATENASTRQIQLHFTVEDSGIGIPADRVHRLFHSFSQVDASTTRKYGGTGLGLAISKRLVEVMGGEIWFESELGVGSKFHFSFWTSIAPDWIRSDIPTVPAAGCNALLIEDNEIIGNLIAAQMKQRGINTLSRKSGCEANAMAKTSV